MVRKVGGEGGRTEGRRRKQNEEGGREGGKERLNKNKRHAREG